MKKGCLRTSNPRTSDALPNMRLKLPAPLFCGGHLFVNIESLRRSLSAIR
jgi:hypothetical protein